MAIERAGPRVKTCRLHASTRSRWASSPPHTGSWKRSETAAREHRPRRAAKGTAPSAFAFSLAEEKGFEPLDSLHRRRFSKPLP